MKKESKKMRKTSEELVSLNENLHSEFTVQELEERLETDPLMLIVGPDTEDPEQSRARYSSCCSVLTGTLCTEY